MRKRYFPGDFQMLQYRNISHHLPAVTFFSREHGNRDSEIKINITKKQNTVLKYCKGALPTCMCDYIAVRVLVVATASQAATRHTETERRHTISATSGLQDHGARAIPNVECSYIIQRSKHWQIKRQVASVSAERDWLVSEEICTYSEINTRLVT